MHNTTSDRVDRRSAYGDRYHGHAKSPHLKVGLTVHFNGTPSGAIFRRVPPPSPPLLLLLLSFTGLAERLPKLTRLQRLDLTVQVIAASKLQPLPLNSCWCICGFGWLWCLAASWWWCGRLCCNRLCESKTKEREGGGGGEAKRGQGVRRSGWTVYDTLTRNARGLADCTVIRFLSRLYATYGQMTFKKGEVKEEKRTNPRCDRVYARDQEACCGETLIALSEEQTARPSPSKRALKLHYTTKKKEINGTQARMPSCTHARGSKTNNCKGNAHWSCPNTHFDT